MTVNEPTSEATNTVRPLRFGVVAPVGSDLAAWRDQVRRVADSGYSTLLVPDVPPVGRPNLT
ncbi:hypothetical protein ABIB25_002217 [Nakamurella sp. UYEF19]